MNKKFTLNFVGLLLGFVVGNVAVTYAQKIYIADAKNTVCWDQSANSLAEVNSWKIQVTYNSNPPIAMQQSCSVSTIGGTFQCQLAQAIPLNLQTGILHIKLEGATVQPDDTLSSWSTLLDSSVTFGTSVPAPTPNSGSNLRLIKLLQAIAHFFHLSY